MSFTTERTLAIRNARKIADFITNLDSFKCIEVASKPVYSHIGALYADVILQSGLNYEHVVKPRVKRILQLYPEAHTLTSFHAILQSKGTASVLQWKHEEKIQRMERLIDFSIERSIDSISDLIQFMSEVPNQENFMKIKGIGPKSLDYLMKLLGFDTIAVDRHIFKFVEMAGIPELDYNNTKLSVVFAADLLDVSRKTLDFSIWKYMMAKEYIKDQNSQLSFELA
jgi:endonuclease III